MVEGAVPFAAEDSGDVLAQVEPTSKNRVAEAALAHLRRPLTSSPRSFSRAMVSVARINELITLRSIYGGVSGDEKSARKVTEDPIAPRRRGATEAERRRRRRLGQRETAT